MITLLALFVVFVLLPQLAKFIKPRPQDDEAPTAEPDQAMLGESIEPLKKQSAPSEIVKRIRHTAAPHEPSPRPIKPRWF